MSGWFGEVAAAALCDGIEQATRSSSRYVIDYLPAQEQRAIFDVLMRWARRALEVPVEDTCYLFHAVHRDNVDIIPILVGEPDELRRGERNVVSDGWACKLRDFYTAGMGAGRRARALLTFTSESNETQKSASEGQVDRDLLSLEALARRLWQCYVLDDNDARVAALKRYLVYRDPTLSIGRAIEKMESFLSACAERPGSEHGAELGRLGCLFPDSRDNWAENMDNNVKLFAAVTRLASDPLADLEHSLTSDKITLGQSDVVFDDTSAARIVQAGLDGLVSIDMAELELRPQERDSRENKFLLPSIRVEGDLLHHVIHGSEHPIVVIAATDACTVHVDLEYEPSSREHVLLVGWDAKKRKLRAEKGAVSQKGGKRHFTVKVRAAEDFAVFRLSLAQGPRSLVKSQDCLWLAVYAADQPWLAYEIDGRLSIESQAWRKTDESDACFECRDSAGQTVTIYRSRADAQAAAVTGAATTDESELDDEGGIGALAVTLSVTSIGADEQRLHPRVLWPDESDDQESDAAPLAWLEAVIYQKGQDKTLRARMKEAFTSQTPYLAAVRSVHRKDDHWVVRMGDELMLRVERWDRHGEEQAVGRLLERPSVQWIRRTHRPEHAEPWIWQENPFQDEVRPYVADFLDVRERLFRRLKQAARALLATQHGRREHALEVPLGFIDLYSLGALVDEYLGSWLRAFNEATARQSGFSSVHRALLDLDTLKQYGENGELERLTVLPTHPWLLWAMYRYQALLAVEVENMNTSRKAGFNLDLAYGEVEQLVHPAPFDDWYDGVDGTLHLSRIDSAPFSWCFVPHDAYRQQGGLEYLARVVKNRIKRYLQIHRHLDHEARTLRIGFVNPGDGRHLLDGIRDWVRSRTGDEQERIPNIEVLLFSRDDRGQPVGSAFDEFFKRALGTTLEDQTTHLLMNKLRYLERNRQWPEDRGDYVHICFVNQLIDDRGFRTKSRRMDDGWDGCFGEGLLATPMGAIRTDGDQHRTEHGLWIADAESSPGRRGLTYIAALLRGRKDGSLDPALGLFWGAELPELGALQTMYEHSNWVVHLDRALSLDVFKIFHERADDEQADESLPVVIEYSDQEEPETPGYDTITVTRYAQPYIDQLAKVLEIVGLPIPDDDAAQKRCGQGLMRDINALSGSSALDFIEGHLGEGTQTSTRLMGHVGVALAYRWLCRVEADELARRGEGPVFPIYISLEELVRATGSAGLPIRDGLYKRAQGDGRATKDGRLPTCDDLLMLYVMPMTGSDVRMVGRVIEVKFSRDPKRYADKAVQQVRGTQELLTKYLSGDPERRDAMFRSKQLSLLLESRIKQLLLMDPKGNRVLDGVDCRQLSALMASGHYSVDYILGHAGQHIRGDVFLLDTSEPGKVGQAHIRESDGVRIIELGRSSLEWLAFQREDARTLPRRPTRTLPDLGRYGKTGSVARGGLDSRDHQEKEGPPEEAHAVEVAMQPVIEPLAEAEPAVEPAPAVPARETPARVSLAQACQTPVKVPAFDEARIADVVRRLERALAGHKIATEAPPSVRETLMGPRLVRVHVRLRPGESIQSVRRISEDIARDVGTQSPDVHVGNVPELHAIGVDLPIDGLSYDVRFDELMEHASFAAAAYELTLGFCAGIDVTGNPVWVDLATMPHALVAGTTGSGKTVFLRQLLLTLLLHKSPAELQIRLSSSKPMDFRLFEQVAHTSGTQVASDAGHALELARYLVDEMDRRINLISEAMCDNLAEFNDENEADKQPYIVAVIDEFAETVLSFEDKSARAEFEKAIARLAQKSRAAGIHMILCMQRPDSAVVQGPIKANILHRFALKLPQNHDSRVILDESGAETLLGQGDMLYKDANGRLSRLQVPNLEKRALKTRLAQIAEKPHS